MEPESRFTAQLYLKDLHGYSETRKARSQAERSAQPQILRFPVPRGVQGLRLDPDERPGLLQLRSMRLVHGGEPAWHWDESEGWPLLEAAARHQLLWDATPGWMLMCGSDPWIELPVPAEVLASDDGELEVEVAWPDPSQAPAGMLRLAMQGLQLQDAHACALTGLLHDARELHFRSRADVRRLMQEKAALRRSQAAAEGRSAPPPLSPVVDVVVPVYLSLSETRRCVESVLRAPGGTPWRLVLVNDASPEPELVAWMHALAASDERVLLLENAENLGYSGAVNRGLCASEDRDVVLLNSDAEVANDWLDRLRAAAYARDQVCSVTPFSNNATICSFPRMCEANDWDPAVPVADVDRAFAAANAGQAIEIPTAVGFCMYVRRDCVRDIGLFDMALFGKGYGEENDFCLRAEDAGWCNLHALDVFVQHTGGVSFGASKPQRELEALALLRRLYPDYERKVHTYIAADPPAAARERVARLLAARDATEGALP